MSLALKPDLKGLNRIFESSKGVNSRETVKIRYYETCDY